MNDRIEEFLFNPKVKQVAQGVPFLPPPLLRRFKILPRTFDQNESFQVLSSLHNCECEKKRK